VAVVLILIFERKFPNIITVFGRWVNLKAIKRLVEAEALKMEIIPNPKVKIHVMRVTS
jgi:hypothetical protein